jgi:O-antigen/teichoic acid export membrane protein
VKLGLRFSPTVAKRLVLYSLPLVGSGLFMFVLHQADRWFVQRIHGEAAVGVYGVAYKLGAMGNAVVLEAFGLIWFPFVFAIVREEEARLVCRKIATYASAGFAFLTLGLALFAEEIVRLMAAEEYRDAARTLPIIAFAYLFWALFQVLHTTFYLRKRTGHIAALVGGAAALNLGLNAVLVPSHGGLGAAWATLGSFAFLTGATWIAAERLWPVGFEVRRVLFPIVLAAGMAWAATHLPAEGSLAWITIAKIVLLVGFLTVLACCGFLDRAEKAKIKALLAEVRWPRSDKR